MKYDKKETVRLIQKKLEGKSFMTYQEIAQITGYHPKYISRLKREIIAGTIELEHGNKNKRPHNQLSLEEEIKIVNLYRKSSASIRKFARFYHQHSYSCIYQILKKHGCFNSKKSVEE